MHYHWTAQLLKTFCFFALSKFLLLTKHVKINDVFVFKSIINFGFLNILKVPAVMQLSSMAYNRKGYLWSKPYHILNSHALSALVVFLSMLDALCKINK